jgi:hypothetical protein
VIQLISPRCSISETDQFIEIVARRIDAENVLQLAGGDDDARGGDEAGDDRVRQEIGEKTEPEQAEREQERAGQERERDRRRYVFRVPCWAMLPTAAAVISETTATGPTASARLVPKIA